jgi:MATE family multidrug resistance protein
MTINLHYSTSNVMTAGLGLSMILIHSLGGSLLYGFNNGYCNFACRAFGAKNQQKFDSYLAQGLLNLGVLLVLLTVMGMLSYRLGVVTGQEEMVAREAYRFYMWQLPGLWCFFLADFLRSYLNAQEIFKELLYANVASCLIHLILSSIFSARYGFYGIILSTNLTFLSLLLIILTLIHLHSPSPFPLKTLLHSQWHSNYLPFLK